jgi:hypothetical protein
MLCIKKIAGALLLLCCITATAQKKSITLTWLPTASIEPDGGITAGAEYGLGNRWSVLADAGIIFYSLTRNDIDGNDGALGYRVRPELRLYFNDKKELSGGFIGLEGFYKHVNYRRYNGIPVFDNFGNLAYTYLGGYRIIKDVIGANLKFGYRFFFTGEKKIGMEVYFGPGGRVKNFAVRDLPPGGVFDRNFFSTRFFNVQWREGGTGSMTGGFKLIWRLK